jgi:hypothetical protein
VNKKSSPIQEKRHKIKVKKNSQIESSGKRLSWTDGEAVKLIVGVELYGHGNWSKIKEVYRKVFHNRTSVQLKDKYRVLVKPANSDYYKRLLHEAKIEIRKLREASDGKSNAS